MNIESLRIFCNVVASGGFSRATSRCRLTQSAISKQIQSLEESLGQKLLERTPHALSLTDAGRLLYERSERIFQEIDSAKDLLKGVALDPTPRLSIGTTLSIGIAYFPGFFKNFSKNHPGCKIDVEVEFSSSLLKRVEDRQLDCAVVCLPKRLPKSLVVAKRFPDPLALIASNVFVRKAQRGGEVSEKQALALMAEEPLILIGSRTYTRKIIDHYLFGNGLHVTPAMELDSFDLIVSFVALGLGLSIVPLRVLPVYARSRSVSCRKLANLSLSRELAVLVHKDRQHAPLIQEFIRHFSF